MAMSDPAEGVPNPFGNGLVPATGGLASATAEFFGRMVETGGRRAGEAMAQALRDGAGNPAQPSWLEGLLRAGREYLGEMAALLPLVAQRLSTVASSGNSDRLLFRATVEAEYVQTGLKRLSDDNDLLVTPETLARIREEAQAEDPIKGLGDPELATELNRLHLLLEGGEARDLPKLLDRLKYDFRRQGRRALSQMRKDLGWLIEDESYSRSYALLDALTRALGEKAVRRVLRRRWLERYAAALRAPQSADQIPALIVEDIRTYFRAAGIKLESELSVLANSRDALVLDHRMDRVYEVRIRRQRPGSPVDDQKLDPTPIHGLDVHGSREGRSYDVAGRELLLPARVHDASQGVAVWSVDKRNLQDQLDNAPDRMLRAWDIGNNNTPVMLFVVDYKEGDLGPYLEMALGCFVTPRKDPLAVGMLILGSMLVGPRWKGDSVTLPIEAGNEVWGLKKTPSDLVLRYDDRSVTCRQIEGYRDAIKFELPRGGEASSHQVPLFAYSRKPVDKDLHRTMLLRTGKGESFRGGGYGVKLEVDPAGFKVPDSIPSWLHYLGIVDSHGQLTRTPRFTTWTEQMSVELGPPSLIVVRTDQEDE